jgi:hypothetical protein
MSRAIPRRAGGPGISSARRASSPRNRGSTHSAATVSPPRSARRHSSFRRCSAPPAEKRADGSRLQCEGREIFAPFDFHQTNLNKRLESGAQPEYHYFSRRQVMY